MQKDPRISPESTPPEWPQGFDIRAEHAEQQELLQHPAPTGAGRPQLTRGTTEQ
ncbi:hypothetical protein [Marinobacterium nitratireducens]|uniref:hypothetical protein n=1 Tax=Marinobacterium nitratireducens TaxID=518897 RepID=UPI0016629763|nr:hypothetical protein [Marinobacterium nitratireducens]